MEELYLNNIRTELTPKTVSRTLQVNDLAEIKDRQANYSNSIKLPKSTHNIETMEYLGISGTTTRLPYISVSVKYILNGIELVSDGTGIIKNTNKFFDLVIYDGNISMKDLLGNDELQDLDFSAHDHTLTQSLFLGSFSNTSGYIYGVARYFSGVGSSLTLPIDVMNPVFYIYTLFEMIFAQKGYTISGGCLVDPDYLAKVISMNNGYDRILTESLTQVYDRNNSGDPEVVDLNLDFLVFKDYIIDSYVSTTDTSHTINLTGSITFTKSLSSVFLITVNNTVVSSFDNIPNASFNLDFETQANVGDTISIVLSVQSDENSDIQFNTNYITTISENAISIPVTFNSLIGDTKQIDFVKDVMQHLGMIFRKTPLENNFEFECIKNILTDKANAENWSSKYSGVLNESYKPNYARENAMRYQYDTDNEKSTQTFGDGIMIVDNVNLTQTKTLFTSLFKASELVNSRYYGLNNWIRDDEEGIIANQDGLRVFTIVKSLDSVSYKFKFDGGGSSVFVGEIPLMVFSSYQTNIDNHYAEFNSMLLDYKKITLSLNLSIVDVYKLDFFKLKYFDQLGQYYYLNKVISFKANQNTKVELIQLGEDVKPANLIEGSYAGSSDYNGTLVSIPFGEMAGGYAGSSSYAGSLSTDEVNTFDLSQTGTTEGLVCSDTNFTERWFSGIGSLPVVSDIVYTDSLGTIPFNGNDLFYNLAADNTYIKINASGVVTQRIPC